MKLSGLPEAHVDSSHSLLKVFLALSRAWSVCFRASLSCLIQNKKPFFIQYCYVRLDGK